MLRKGFRFLTGSVPEIQTCDSAPPVDFLQEAQAVLLLCLRPLLPWGHCAWTTQRPLCSPVGDSWAIFSLSLTSVLSYKESPGTWKSHDGCNFRNPV